jgi:predicted CXXCH cytochrome family protein
MKEIWRMEKHSRPRPGTRVLAAAFLIASAVLLFSAFQTRAGSPPAEGQAANLAYRETAFQTQPEDGSDEYCLSCHANPDMTLTLPNGDVISLHVSPDDITHSVHGDLGITCRACHVDIHTYPHPPIPFQSARELSLSYYEACQRCHKNLYEETLDSIHAEFLLQGDPRAPVCTDCHGAHQVLDPDQPRSRVSFTCGQCHTEILEVYQHSVHGAALIQEDNPDVPVCTDCHGVHDIYDPRTIEFRIAEPELCAGCHANEELMAKYGLSADVYTTYDLSWHGVDVAVFQARWPNLWHQSAVCSDCHGVHDILSHGNPASRVHPDNLLGTCQQCHEGAGPLFVSAWTGHYDISVERTPFVYYTEVFYSSFTPFVLILSAVYVVLQIIRINVRRARRSL